MRRTNILPWLALGLSGLLQISIAQIDPDDPNHGVRWVYPPRSEMFTFHYMDTIEVQWTSYFDEPILYTFCTSESGDVAQKSMDYVEAFNGSKAIPLDWTDEGSPCWFNLRPNTTVGYGSNSNQWAYDLTQRSRVTFGADSLSTATATTTTTSISIATSSAMPSLTAATANAAATPSDSSSSPNGAGLSVGAQAGIGVAAGMVGIGFGVLGAIMCMRRRNRQKGVGDSAYAGMPAQCYSGYDYKRSPSNAAPPISIHCAMPRSSEIDSVSPRPELEARTLPTELPAGYYGR